MKAEEIKLFDFGRIFLGEVPWVFLLEVALRSIFLYLLLILSMRLMGKRMASQVGRNEMAALVSLAAAIGIPLEAPERGLIPALLVAAVIVLIQRWISSKASKSEEFESFIFDDYSTLVADGAMNLKAMVKCRITKERLFAQLRSCGLTHLGLVKRVYMESNGRFTILRSHPPEPSLTIIPNEDKEFEKCIPITTHKKVCENCGKLNPSGNTHLKCVNCHRMVWVDSVG